MAKEKQNIQELTVPEVEEKIRTMKQEIFTLRFRNAMRQLDNPLRIRFLRRDIARYTTALAEHRKGIRFLATGEDLTPGGEAAASQAKAAKKAAAKKAAAEASAATPAKTEAKVAAKTPAKTPAKKTSVKSATEASPKDAAPAKEKPKRRVPWGRGKKDKE